MGAGGTEPGGEAPSAAPRRSLLDEHHRAAGARMTPFGGWEMPLQYDGVLQEHARCRDDAVVFDVSHLGGARVRGAGALDGLQGLLTNDLTRIAPGRAQYTHLLDPDDAHVVDDIIVWWIDEDDFLVIPNASNTLPALEALRQVVPTGEVDEVTDDRAFLAVQGPRARERLKEVLPEAAETERFAVREAPGGVLVGGTGYTGEDGVELHVPAEQAADVWQALVAAGVSPAGLGARDTLRLEMGYPLHGHELGPGITPLQAGLGWVVAWDKGEFRGRRPLEAERAGGVHRLLRGLMSPDRRIPRDGCTVLVDDRAVGRVTSGNFSPVLGRGIALALIESSVDLGAAVEVDVRGRRVPAEITTPPFIDR